MAEWAVLADDFTGAMDTGLQFAKSGMSTVFDLGSATGEYDAIVLSSNSRGMAPASARRAAADLGARARPLSQRFYKKIDSTLRGNIGPELQAIIQELDVRSVVLAPAFPGQGRCTVEGVQYVRGIRVAHSEAARDPIAPVFEDCIPNLIAETSSLRSGHVALDEVRSDGDSLTERLTALTDEGVQVIVVDAESEQDLKSIAASIRAAGLDRLAAGSAGLAEHLVITDARPSPSRSLTRSRRQAVLVGSFSAVSRSQVAHAARTIDAALYEPTVADFEHPERAMSHAIRALDSGRAWIGFAGHLGRPLTEPSAVESLDSWLGAVSSSLQFEIEGLGLVMTGGETASICLASLQAGAIEIAAEVQSGVAGGMISGGPHDGRMIVTKAGAFGADDALAASVRWLADPAH